MTKKQLIIKNTDELTSSNMITIMQERTKIFVVEQECAYQEVDQADFKARHVYLTIDDQLVAYTRIIADDNPQYIRFGRVLVTKPFRGQHYGREIVSTTIQEIHRIYPNQTIKIGAQNYLRQFYESFGFKPVSDVYLEDNIPHIDMTLVGGH